MPIFNAKSVVNIFLKFSNQNFPLRITSVLFAIFLVACDARDNADQSITEAKAIEIAKEVIAKHELFSVDNFTDRTVEVEKLDSPKSWDISFPDKEDNLGGEPHVIVKQDTGEIIDVYHTR